MPSTKRIVLITGCSNAGIGSALAIELHKAGFDVIATARDISKMSDLKPLGIKLLALDVNSAESIAAVASSVTDLDMLINNAGHGSSMPLSDVTLDDARACFDTNVWGAVAVTQAFLPHLRRSTNHPTLVMHGSIASIVPVPFQGVYNASKAALAALTDVWRLELEPFGIAVVELRTGGVASDFASKLSGNSLPDSSWYVPARSAINTLISAEWIKGEGMKPETWAKSITPQLGRSRPANVLWEGDSVWAVWFANCLPRSLLTTLTKRRFSMDKIAAAIRGDGKVA